jgi:thiamine-phosphate pyrophosphorylase
VTSTGPRGADLIGARRLYLCTPDRADLEAFLHACIDGGVDLVQLREKRLDDRQLLARASLARGACNERDVPFLLNDRPDLALGCGAGGVHVGQDDAPPQLARHILGPEAIVGLSTHAPDELALAVHEPVDYLSAGPVVPTPTKPGRAGTGSEYVAEAARACRDAGDLPFFVTGGVTPEAVPALTAAGARRFVVVRYLTESPDPRAAARLLRVAIDATALTTS